MSSNGNGVNIEKRGYHHGDLRAALLAEGLTMLEGAGAPALSLREVARRAGVSATSVYRHFPDKAALMAALAAEGLARLAEAQHRAAEAAGGGAGAAGFAATGRAYVRFALASPALFRLIFASPGVTAADAGEPEAMAFLRRNAAAAVGGDIDDPAARVRAVHAWSLVHGLAMLMLDGQVQVDDALIDQVVAAD